jgi:AcrR family transcriptional regulator
VIVDPAKRPGRPRSVEADAAILDAALEVFADAGFDGFTIEEVAARAGVGKATIYRRYPCKVDLVMAAAGCVAFSAAVAADTGNVADDLRAVARGLVELLTKSPAGRAVPQVVAAVERNEELRRAHHGLSATRRASTTDAVRRGIERGELPPDTDPELVADMIAGPIFYRRLLSGARLDATYADRVVDTVLRAVAAMPVA